MAGMGQKEQELLVSELETRLDRLRHLYDQYFLGFEKLEPQVPRKDVERRIDQLRKEQIRNTALRFRFNVVAQKYNTYSTLWGRTCRQIEEGTFKRHIQKAKNKFGRDPIKGGVLDDVDVDLSDFENMDDGDLEDQVARDMAAMEAETTDVGGRRPAAARDGCACDTCVGCRTFAARCRCSPRSRSSRNASPRSTEPISATT